MSICEKSDAAVKREFAKQFPTIALEFFRSIRKGRGYVLSSNSACVSGTAAELCRLGFLEEHMVPPGRKRHLHGNYSAGNGSSWGVRRLKGGRLEAHFTIRGDDADESVSDRMYVDDFPLDHPLQSWHPRLWPFGDAAEMRSYFATTLDESRSRIASYLDALHRYLDRTKAFGYCIRATDRDRMRQMVNSFEEELLQAFDGARVVSVQAPKLGLVSASPQAQQP